MADGRHFENSFIAISQPEITRFQRNLVRICRLCFQGWLNKIPKFCKFKMADGRHIENRISTNNYRINAKFCRIKQSRFNTGHIGPKYQSSKIQDGGPPPFWKWFYRYIYLSRKSSDLNEIWYADADCAYKVGYLINKILKFCKFKMADGRHIENSLLAISQRVIIGLTRNFVG